MNLTEDTPLLEVHPPHEPVHGWRDFFIHLATITIGLLIALSLEGLVEWRHHRHLVHEAEVSLHEEIKHNSESMQATIDDINSQQQKLKKDVEILKLMIESPGKPHPGELDISFRLRSFDSVSWKTAQSTGALSYMPYDHAQDYSDIYATQDEIQRAESIAVRDTIFSVAPFLNAKKSDPDPTPQQADQIKQKIEILQGQLMYVENLIMTLDKSYKKFLAANPH